MVGKDETEDTRASVVGDDSTEEHDAMVCTRRGWARSGGVDGTDTRESWKRRSQAATIDSGSAQHERGRKAVVVDRKR